MLLRPAILSFRAATEINFGNTHTLLMLREDTCLVRWPILMLLLLLAGSAHAQFPYSQSFKDVSAPGLVLAGVSRLTANTVDAPGSGYLRLTDTIQNQVGCVYAEDSFPSQNGIVASFEFFTWTKVAGTPADGFSFFLFDASISSFRAGPTGGALGYTQKWGTPGLDKGYIGIGIDEFGNYSVISDGNKSGGTASKVNPAVVIRGPGNGAAGTDYPYVTGVQTNTGSHTTPFNGFFQRYWDSSNVSYRRLKIIMKPGSTLGTAGYKVTIVMYKGAGTTNTPVVADTLINNYDYPYAAPSKLQYGLIASTGSVTAFHEIRNMQIEAYNATTAPMLRNDTVYVCSGNQRLIDVTANDSSTNSGGVISKASIDLDPATAGIQTSFTDAGKGTYSVDATTGLVNFTPIGSYTGASSITYTAKDNYGVAAITNGTIVVNVTSGSALALNVTDPAGVCGSGTVNIAAASVTSGSTAGATFSYFNTLTDALNGSNNINSGASAISTPGTYYIRADLSGCYTAKPVNVVISQTPTTALAGSNQSMCISSNLLATLQANSPTVGTGAWSQVSGPATASIAIPMSSNTPVQMPATAGAYVLRWTVSNGVCTASTSDITITVSALATTANAGGNHTICNATSYTLSGNTAAVGTGAWTVPYNTSGLTPSFSNTTSPTATVTNLSPGNTYTFQWKITNGACSSQNNDTLRISQSPTIATTNGNQILSGATSATVQGNTPTVGTGSWSQISGPAATIATPSNATTNLNGLTGGNTYVFRWTISNGVCTPSSSDLTITNNNISLPIEFLSFTGARIADEAILQWKTADERNTQLFQVERSLDGISFSDIAAVAAHGGVAGGSYQYIDSYPASAAQRRFYRIAELENSGSRHYSKTIVLNGATAQRIGVQPNPFAGQLSIDVYGRDGEAVSVTLCDMAGRALLSSSGAQLSGGNHRMVLDQLQNLPAGVYLLKVLVGAETTVRTVSKM